MRAFHSWPQRMSYRSWKMGNSTPVFRCTCLISRLRNSLIRPPINSKARLEKIEELVASGKEEGAEIYQPVCRLPERGYWFVPTLFTNVAQSYRIAQEEILGPVLSVLTFRTPREGGREGEQHRIRPLGGSVDGEGLADPVEVERLRAGVVWASTFNRFDPSSPFGGYKESGFGREGGRHGLEPYLRFDDEH